MCEVMPVHDLGESFTVQVMYSLNDPAYPPLSPWLALHLGHNGPVWNPNTTGETAAALRALADDLDHAWQIFNGRSQ